MSTGAIGFPGRMPTNQEVADTVAARTPVVTPKVTKTAARAAALQASAVKKPFVKPLLRVDEDPDYVPVNKPLATSKLAVAKLAAKPAKVATKKANSMAVSASTQYSATWGSPVVVSKGNFGPTLTKLSAEGKTIFSIITSPDVQNSYVVFYYE